MEQTTIVHYIAKGISGEIRNDIPGKDNKYGIEMYFVSIWKPQPIARWIHCVKNRTDTRDEH